MPPAKAPSPVRKPPTDYSQKRDHVRDSCPVKATIDVIRGRWKPMILWELHLGIRRFTDLQAVLPEVSPQILTVQLRQLEADGVITRTVYAEIPARVEYALTEHGEMLSEAMDQLEKWGLGYLQRQGLM